jgi:hypothetical protein
MASGGDPGGDVTSLTRSVGPQAAPLCGIGRVARPPSARLGRAAGTLNLARERSAHMRAGPCAERSGAGHQRFGCPTPSVYESQERFDMACRREREWVVSGACVLGRIRAGRWGPTAVGAGRPAPPRSMVRVPGSVTRWRTSIPSTCDVDLRPGPRWVVGVAYSRTTFSTRVPRVMPRRSTTRRARLRTVSWSTPGCAVTSRRSGRASAG